MTVILLLLHNCNVGDGGRDPRVENHCFSCIQILSSARPLELSPRRLLSLLKQDYPPAPVPQLLFEALP